MLDQLESGGTLAVVFLKGEKGNRGTAQASCPAWGGAGCNMCGMPEETRRLPAEEAKQKRINEAADSEAFFSAPKAEAPKAQKEEQRWKETPSEEAQRLVEEEILREATGEN